MTDAIVIDPNKLPERFLKLFKLDKDASNLESRIKDIFKRTRFLNEIDSHRIVLVDDKIIVFRNEERLTHKDGWNLTQWEKRRTEIVTTFNTFSNIYDAVRSHYHTINSENQNQNNLENRKRSILELVKDLKNDVSISFPKDALLKRKLEDISLKLENARNAKVLATSLYNLEKITFKNKSIDTSRLKWWENKLNLRFEEISSMIWKVSKHLEVLESILTEYENNLDFFLSQITFADKSLSIYNYTRDYKELEQKYWSIQPFDCFFWFINKHNKDKLLFEKIINRMGLVFKLYKDEHDTKIKWQEFFNDFSDIKDDIVLLETFLLFP